MSKTKITAPKYPPLMCVEWVDTMNVATWQPLAEVEGWATGGGFACRNVGYLVFEDDACVVLAGRFNLDGAVSQVGLAERIPKGMIQRRWTIEALA